jgi:SH3-like domain-containing protein
LVRRLLVLLLFVAGMAGTFGHRLGPATAQSTGLPLPRFVSLASDEINVRTGPGQMHPIRWVFTRRGVPVQIVEEAQDWRRIVDHEGETGWIHASLLSSRRTILVTGDTRPLRRTPRHDARIVALVEPLVIGSLLNCERNWCLVEIENRRGWLERGQFYGALESEMSG